MKAICDPLDDICPVCTIPVPPHDLVAIQRAQREKEDTCPRCSKSIKRTLEERAR